MGTSCDNPLLMGTSPAVVQGTRFDVRTPLFDVRTLHIDTELSGEEAVELVELLELKEVLHLNMGGSGSPGGGKPCRIGYLQVMADMGVMEQSPGG